MATVQSVLDRLGYGLYIVSSCSNGRCNGQISNAVMQVTAFPPKIAVSINKKELTHDYIRDSGLLSVSILAETAPMSLIGLFGFQSGRDVNKFADVSHIVSPRGCPIVIEHSVGLIEARVIGELDAGTHTVFLADAFDAKAIGGVPMTYAYYYQELKGKAHQNAPTYSGGTAASTPAPVVPTSAPAPAPVSTAPTPVAFADGSGRYICDICRYIYDPAKGDADNDVPAGTSFDALPDTWTCPVCGVGKDQFSPSK